MRIEVNNAKTLTYKDFSNIMKEKYNLIYVKTEGIEGLVNFHKFRLNGTRTYFEINDDNIMELAEQGYTEIKEW